MVGRGWEGDRRGILPWSGWEGWEGSGGETEAGARDGQRGSRVLLGSV